MQWVVGQEYRTRDGRRARVYATDVRGDYPVHGCVHEHDAWGEPESWTADGRYVLYETSELDLMPPRTPVEVSDAVLASFLATGALGAFDRGAWVREFREGLSAAISAYLAEREAD